MKHIKLFEQFLNEGKSFEFTFNYNTDEDDVEYVQNILHNAGVDAIAEPGLDSEEMMVKAKNAVELRKAKKAIQADGFEVNESVVNEGDMTKFYDGFIVLDNKSKKTYKFKYVKGTKNTEVESNAISKLASSTKEPSSNFMVHGFIQKGEWSNSKEKTIDESVINEAKGYSFTIKYSDAKHVQQVLDDAGVDALAKAGVDDEEVIVRAFDGMGLRKAKQVIHAEVTTEFKVNEGINVKDIKVGTILNFKDGETWKVTKTSGISSGKIFAAPYGDTKKSYVSLPIEFSTENLEKDVTSIE